MADKILKYGRDPVAFHLHKNANFIQKLKEEEKKLAPEDFLMCQKQLVEQEESDQSSDELEIVITEAMKKQIKILRKAVKVWYK